MSFSPLAIPPDTLTLLHGCMMEREAAFWLVSEMYIFISVKMPKNRGRSFRGSIKKNGYPSGSLTKGRHSYQVPLLKADTLIRFPY